MTKVIGVRFRTAGKVYFFDPLQFEIKRGDHVIVETARGIEYGTVISGVHEVEDDKVIQPLKPVIRIANQRDVEQEAANKLKEREAYKICLEKIRKHELEMKLIDAEYTFDNNKVLFYFTADGRIDFRELVKDLASVFKTRIELRQIGVRDETKIVGGIGICGRPLCCHSYLSDFIPVSIKMAKEQNLSLNPTKISGVCGRLMCCLKNEEETYEYLNRRLPGIGDTVTTEDGLQGEVQSVNVLRQLVKVVVDVDDEKEIREYEVDKLRFKRKHNKKERLELSQEELKELERLEQEEIQEEAEAAQERRQEKRENGAQERRQEKRDGGTQERRQERRDNGAQERRQNRRGEAEQDERQNGRSEAEKGQRQNGRSEAEQNQRQNGRSEAEQNQRQNGQGEAEQNQRQESAERQDRRNDGNQERRRDRRERQDRRNNNRNGQNVNDQDRRNGGSENRKNDPSQNENRKQEGKAESRQSAQTDAEGQQEQRKEGRNHRHRRHRNRNGNDNGNRNGQDGRKPENNGN